MKTHCTQRLALTAGILLLTATAGWSATITNGMVGTQFSPMSRTVNVGDTVVWVNTSGLTHTVTGQGSDPFCGGTFLSGSGGTCMVTFNTAGTFNYTCTVHFNMNGSIIVQPAVNVPPSVSLTNPPSGKKFRAPASFPLIATASDSDGSITNVQFFSDTNLLGNDTTSPFSIPLLNLAAGIYNFTARAADNRGSMATSAVVNVHVLTNAVLTSPINLGGAGFRVTVRGIAGQTYIMESSSNLLNWSAIATNLAPSNTFDVTDPVGTTKPELRVYRARQDL